MSHINEKMGMKPAGKRRQMKLPTSRAEAARLTSTVCPNCPHRWIVNFAPFGVPMQMCAWCSTSWPVVAAVLVVLMAYGGFIFVAARWRGNA